MNHEGYTMNIKDIVKDNVVRFARYRHQMMYYRVVVEDVTYEFPVPLEDVQDASLHAEEKAITYMRYIRKSTEDGTFIRVNA